MWQTFWGGDLRPALALEPPRRRARRLAHGGHAAGGGARRRVPAASSRSATAARRRCASSPSPRARDWRARWWRARRRCCSPPAPSRSPKARSRCPTRRARSCSLTGLVPARDATTCSSRRPSRPASPVWRLEAEANDAGVIETPWDGKDGRLRVRTAGHDERSEPMTRRPRRATVVASLGVCASLAFAAGARASAHAEDHEARDVRHAGGGRHPLRDAGLPARQPLEPGHLGAARAPGLRGA